MYFHSAQATPTVSDSQRLKNTHFWLPARTDEKTPGEEGRTAQRKRKKKKRKAATCIAFSAQRRSFDPPFLLFSILCNLTPKVPVLLFFFLHFFALSLNPSSERLQLLTFANLT